MFDSSQQEDTLNEDMITCRITFEPEFDGGKNKEIKADHLASTNLHYFKALISCLISCRNVVAVFQCFYLKTKDGTVKQINVDIVSENGKVWIKVSARNPKALLQLSLGQGEYGQRSILDQAEDLVACASQCKHQFTPPLFNQQVRDGQSLLGELGLYTEENGALVVFHFSKTLESVLIQQLESLGVKISMGEIYLFATIDDEEVTHPFIEKDIDKLNLDVSTMIAYISALTNGSANFIFCDQILNDQAEQERKEPLKPILDRLFEACQYHSLAPLVQSADHNLPYTLLEQGLRCSQEGWSFAYRPLENRPERSHTTEIQFQPLQPFCSPTLVSLHLGVEGSNFISVPTFKLGRLIRIGATPSVLNLINRFNFFYVTFEFIQEVLPIQTYTNTHISFFQTCVPYHTPRGPCSNFG
uniref:Uncharacterized protein n=1 Tax=Timema douglasi TaxID=61478 RepID=A0A7R8Z6E4_TIMDO|nr:unnamed protein product [Timema douglasi]